MKELKNIDKIKDDELKQSLIYWHNNISDVTINDDGLYMFDLIQESAFSEAKL